MNTFEYVDGDEDEQSVAQEVMVDVPVLPVWIVHLWSQTQREHLHEVTTNNGYRSRFEKCLRERRSNGITCNVAKVKMSMARFR